MDLKLVGAGVFAAGMLTFLFVLFGQGGSAKSKQFAVIGAVLGGQRGAAARAAMITGMALIVVGAGITFTGVARGDRQRRARCVAECRRRGFSQATIGPSTARDPRRKGLPAFVACRCSGGSGEDVELPADSLVD